MATLGDLIIRIGGEADAFVTTMKNVMDLVDTTVSQVQDRLKGLTDIGRELATLGASLSAGITVPLEEAGRKALMTAAQFEQVQIAFNTFLGDANDASKLLGDLYNFAATTPFQVPGILQAGRTLLAMGFAGKDVVPILRVMGDAASGLGLGQQGLERFVFHLGQIRALGHVNGILLREMGQNGVAAAQMIAAHLGVSVPEVTKMVEKKDPRVSADEVIKALLEGMNLQFGGSMLNQMQSLTGMWSNFRDRVIFALRDVGNALLPLGKVVVTWADQLLTVVQRLTASWQQLPGPVQAAGLSLVGLAAVAGPLIGTIGGIGFALPHLVAGLAAMARFGSFIATAVSGVIEYIVTLVALAQQFGVVATAGLVFTDGLAAVSALFLGWPALIALVVAGLAALATWVYTHWAGVKAALATLWDGLTEAINSGQSAATTQIADFFNRVNAMAEESGRNIGNAIKRGIEEGMSTVTGITTVLKALAITQAPGVPGIFGKMGESFRDAEAASKVATRLDEAKRDLLGSSVPNMTDPKVDWDEKQAKKIKKAVEDLAELKKAFDQGKLSADDFNKASARVDFLKDAKNPFAIKSPTNLGKGKDKVDQVAVDKLKGELEAEEALFKIRRKAAEEEFKQSEPSNLERRGETAQQAAAQNVAAAATRRQQLQAIDADELRASIANVEQKMKLYKGDSKDYQDLLNEKKKAQLAFVQEFQAAGFQEKDVQKRVNDDLAREERRHQDEMKKVARDHAIAIAQMANEEAQIKIRLAEEVRRIGDQQAKAQLDLGLITKAQYLAIKQSELDEAYRMELKALEEEQRLLDIERSLALNGAIDDRDRGRINDRFDQRQVQLNGKRQGLDTKRNGDTLGIGNELKQDNYNRWFKPIESSFTSGITAMIQGTKTFKQAFADMGRSILDSWIKTLIQQKVAYFTAKLQEVIFHRAADQMKVASTAQAAAQTHAISLREHLHQVLLSAKSAAAGAWQATVHIPFVGPIIAPIAAAATFAGVMMYSAEHGAVMPNENTIAMLHPREMVLPSHLAEGIQDLIATGTAPSHKNMGFMPSGAPTSQVQQTMAAASAGGDSHFHGGIQLTYHASKGENLSSETVFSMVQRAARMKNLKMA